MDLETRVCHGAVGADSEDFVIIACVIFIV